MCQTLFETKVRESTCRTMKVKCVKVHVEHYESEVRGCMCQTLFETRVSESACRTLYESKVRESAYRTL